MSIIGFTYFFDKTISKEVKWRSWIHPNFACQGNSFICTKSHYHLTLVYLGMDLGDAGEVHFFYFHAVSWVKKIGQIAPSRMENPGSTLCKYFALNLRI